MKGLAALLLWGAAGCAYAAVPSTPGSDLDEVMRLLGARRHGEVDFIEQHFLAVLKRPVESSGELIYDAPGRLEKRTLEPHPEDLLLTDEGVTVQRRGRSRLLDLKAYPQLKPFVESMRGTLAGDRQALQRVFRLEFAGDVARWTLTLKPLDPALAGAVAQVQIDGSADALYRIEIRQADGDRSLMTLRPHAAR